MLRICMLLERAKLKQDGRVRREIRALTGAGHEVILLHHGPGGQEQDALRSDGARTRTVRPGGLTGRLLGRAPRPLERVVLWARYAWVAARSRPDVLHAHDLPMLGPAWLAAAATGAPLVYDSHEYAAGVPYGSRAARAVTRVLLATLVRRADAVIAVSPEAAERIAADHRLPAAAVLRNVPALDWHGAPDAAAPVRDLRGELGVGGAPLVLHQGAASPARGCVELVEAIARLDDVHLLFLGDPDPDAYGDDLRAAARRHGVDDRVHLLPAVPVEILLAHTRQVDVGVCLSDPAWLNHRLTLSNKLFEYVAAGLPVVATRDTAFGALVERMRLGVTVPFGDVDALAAGVSQALGADAALRTRLAAAGRELTWEREQQRLLEVYAGLPGRRSSRHSARSIR